METKRKVSVETRQQLLRTLNAPEGSVVISRKPTPSEDIIEVRMTSPNAVPKSRRPDTFGGFHVDYHIVKPPKAGKW